MNKQLVILIDQDGVLADYTKKLLEETAREFPQLPVISARDSLHFNTEQQFPREYGERIDALSLREGFILGLEPIEGALVGINTLLEMGHDVRICTSPKKTFNPCVLEKFAWVEKYLGQKWVERMILTRDKTLVHGDILIDDKPKISGVHSPSWQHIIYDQAYNQDAQGERCTWRDYMKLFDKR